MNTDPTLYQDIQAPQPDMDALVASYNDLQASIEGAQDAETVRSLLGTWESLRRGFDTWECIAHLRYSQDTSDEDRKKTREQCDEWKPRFDALEVSIKRALLQHPARPELEQMLGTQAFALWSADEKVISPEIQESRVQEGKLDMAYMELMSSMKVEFRGETYNLPGIRKYLTDKDRQTRHDAYKCVSGWMMENADKLDEIYGDMVRLRHEMAVSLGYDNYIGMGYDRRQRVDYNQQDVEVWRKEVIEHIVPLSRELQKRQAQGLGLEGLKAWDKGVHGLQGNPEPNGGMDWMIERATQMFDEMDSEELGTFFRALSTRGYLDLDTRENKAGGGFCTGFATEQMPYVFANFNGTKHDAEVFTHEIGHAFQYWKSADKELMDYAWPTIESAEIHSMSLEFLTWPHMEKFFGEDAERFRQIHLMESLMFLPYGVAVDHFQHLVYENPNATAEERLEMWREMEATYMPELDWDDVTYGARGRRWQLQAHIYSLPFYYVDYTLAQAVALQFWTMSTKDPEGAIKIYKELCARGGSAPFQELVTSSGFTSPLRGGFLGEVVAQAREALGL